MTVRNAPPYAGSMLESLRGLGYALPTALADLVDNSITANSSEVAIHLEWAGPDSWVRIVTTAAAWTTRPLNPECALVHEILEQSAQHSI